MEALDTWFNPTCYKEIQRGTSGAPHYGPAIQTALPTKLAALTLQLHYSNQHFLKQYATGLVLSANAQQIARRPRAGLAMPRVAPQPNDTGRRLTVRHAEQNTGQQVACCPKKQHMARAWNIVSGKKASSSLVDGSCAKEHSFSRRPAQAGRPARVANVRLRQITLLRTGRTMTPTTRTSTSPG